MRQSTQVGFGLLAILAAGMTLCAMWPPAMASSDSEHEDQGQSQSQIPLTAQEIRNLVDRAIENQHRNDVLLDQYARTEHEVLQGTGKESNREIVRRLIPAGMLVLRVELEHNGKTTDASYLDEQWRTVAQALRASARGEEIRGAGLYEGERHRHQRAEMVGEIGKAYVFTWAGRVTINGRTAVKLNFEADPAYRSTDRFAPVFRHSKGTAWVDEASAQMIKAEAELTDDVSWGGGLIAKLYRGGRFRYEQHEVSDGVWMPTYYSYDFDGRKFVFSLSAHDRSEYSEYLHVGSPDEALLVVRREHPKIFANVN
jgi:hypothetical protein